MADPRVDVTRADAVLIGGGVASATLAALLSELEPSWTIEVLEKLDDLGQESSEGWTTPGPGPGRRGGRTTRRRAAAASVGPPRPTPTTDKFRSRGQSWANRRRN